MDPVSSAFNPSPAFLDSSDLPTLESAFGEDEEDEQEPAGLETGGGGGGGGGTGGGPGDALVAVKFLWVSHAAGLVDPVSMLTSNKVNGGLVELHYSELYEGFISNDVKVETGSHEGQLCTKYSDGYEDMYPVKPFQVAADSDIVVIVCKKKADMSQFGTQYLDSYSSQSSSQSRSHYGGQQSGQQMRLIMFSKPTTEYQPSTNSKIQFLEDEPYQGNYGVGMKSTQDQHTTTFQDVRNSSVGSVSTAETSGQLSLGSNYNAYMTTGTTSGDRRRSHTSDIYSTTASRTSTPTVTTSSGSVSGSRVANSYGGTSHMSPTTDNFHSNNSSNTEERAGSATDENTFHRMHQISGSPRVNDVQNEFVARGKYSGVSSTRSPSNSQSPQSGLSGRRADGDSVSGGAYSPNAVRRLAAYPLAKPTQVSQESTASVLRTSSETTSYPGAATTTKSAHSTMFGSPSNTQYSSSVRQDSSTRSTNSAGGGSTAPNTSFSQDPLERMSYRTYSNDRTTSEMVGEGDFEVADNQSLKKDIYAANLQLGFLEDARCGNNDVNISAAGGTLTSGAGKVPFTSSPVTSSRADVQALTMQGLRDEVRKLQKENKSLLDQVEKQQKEFHARLDEHRSAHSKSSGYDSSSTRNDPTLSATSAFHEKVAALENEVDSGRQEKEAMQQVILGNCQRIADLEKTLKKKVGLLNSQKELIQENDSINEKLQRQMSYWQEEHEAMQQKLKGYKDMFAKSSVTAPSSSLAADQIEGPPGSGGSREEEEEALGVELPSIREQVEKLQRECRHLEEHLERTSSAVLSRRSELEAVAARQEELMQTAQANRDLQESLQIARAQCSSSEEALAGLSSEVERLGRQLGEQQSNRTALEGRALQGKRTAERLQAELDRKSAEASELKASALRASADLEAGMNDLKSEKAHLLTENAHLRELTKNPSRYEETKAENEQLKEKIAKLENNLKHFRDKSVELGQQLKLATDPSHLDAVQKKVQDLKREREDLRGERDKLLRKIQGQDMTIEIIQGHLLSLQQAKKEVDIYKEENSAMMLEREGLLQELQFLKKAGLDVPPGSVSFESGNVTDRIEPEDERLSTSTADRNEQDSVIEEDLEPVMRQHPSAKRKGKKLSSPKGLKRGSPTPTSTHLLPDNDMVTLETDKGKAPFVTLQKGDTQSVGRRVLVKRGDGYEWGLLRYLSDLTEDEDFAGVELDKPTGKNNGYHDKKKKQYFTCPDKQGVFTKVQRVFLPALTDETYQV